MSYEICPIDSIDFEKNYTDGSCAYKNLTGCENIAKYSVLSYACYEGDEVFVCREHLPKGDTTE